jgi:hypothetical protein
LPLFPSLSAALHRASASSGSPHRSWTECTSIAAASSMALQPSSHGRRLKHASRRSRCNAK